MNFLLLVRVKNTFFFICAFAFILLDLSPFALKKEVNQNAISRCLDGSKLVKRLPPSGKPIIESLAYKKRDGEQQ